MDAKAESDPEFAAALEAAHEAYRAERDTLLRDGSDPAPSGGVGGSTKGVKCLHAHYAHHRSGAANPIGEIVAHWIEPLDCAQPCVRDGELNPDWVNRP